MGRPRRAILSPEKIYRAALELVDEFGDFTLPGLAQRLSVSPSSIYHHVQGRPEIINGIRSVIGSDALASGDFFTAGPAWQNRAAAWARSYRSALGQHAKAIPLLVGEAVTDKATLDIYEQLAALFAGAGFGPNDVVVAVTALDSFMLGSTLDWASPEAAWVADPASQPALHEAFALATLEGRRSDLGFEVGVEAIITHLETLLPGHQRAATSR
ncbi:TetR/AcrR family transcriptional regulator C-terminal domain-containing protein [uncultured Arthrobacter sp.]|uniref:TetR/AcrR family transcriptional regulator C-terminal domain-containing protein n=1 Tax=uncultured Arthrobacter sp. TaxID=114050 RepID=UPI0025EDAF64|nr:TetR/AcrR family transcriptional regulator C-terminal domain-containing protein [uncultured Arthrobacter sp.]